MNNHIMQGSIQDSVIRDSRNATVDKLRSSLKETLYLLSTDANAKRLMEAMDEINGHDSKDVL